MPCLIASPFDNSFRLDSSLFGKEEEVVLTSDGESEIASEDENEFLGDFSDTNCESIVLYR